MSEQKRIIKLQREMDAMAQALRMLELMFETPNRPVNVHDFTSDARNRLETVGAIEVWDDGKHFYAIARS